MAIKKEYSKDKAICKVTFTLPQSLDIKFERANLVGDFNNWQSDANHFVKNLKDNSFSVELELEASKEYRFRYLIDGLTWLNDSEADKYEPTPFGVSENCVIVV
jgi:1,4-alpha-glucan branching enzyme